MLAVKSKFVIGLTYSFQTMTVTDNTTINTSKGGWGEQRAEDFKQKSGGFVFLAIELCMGGDIEYVVKNEGKLSEEVAKFWAIEIILGLQAMHKRNIVYRYVIIN